MELKIFQLFLIFISIIRSKNLFATLKKDGNYILNILRSSYTHFFIDTGQVDIALEYV